MMRMTSHFGPRVAWLSMLAFGVVACSPGESRDAPEGEEVEAAAPGAEAPDAAPAEAPEPVVRTVPAGTVMAFHVQETVSTETHATGDVFTASVGSDVVDSDGTVLVPAGTRSRWMVSEAGENEVDGETVLAFHLEAVELGGEWMPVQATVTEADLDASASDSRTESVAKVAVGAAAGAILGQVIGKDTESTLKGAGVGAAVGTVVALTTRGSKVTLPEGSIVTVRIDEPVTVR
jgi:hypothetical protein